MILGFIISIHIQIQHHVSSFFCVLASGLPTVASGPLLANFSPMAQTSIVNPLVKRSLHKSILKLFIQSRNIIYTHSLTLTMDFSNLWKHCYRFTYAFFTQHKTTRHRTISVSPSRWITCQVSAFNSIKRQIAFHHYFK